MESIKQLKELKRDDIEKYGGKAASLGELSNIEGVAVPPGFALSTKVSKTNADKYEADILKWFDRLGAKYVAVRSSATREDAPDTSFAGQFETFLNVNRDDLLNRIKECYESIRSSKIENYVKSQNIDIETVKLAVVVQKMVQSDISGIAFSVNPISQNPNEVMIEAGFGLGEYVVAGIITPDKYIFDKKLGKLKESKINYQVYRLALGSNGNEKTEVPLVRRNAQKLPSKYFDGLLNNVLSIEKHYGQPIDIEWAVADGVVYITQARPITTLNNKT